MRVAVPWWVCWIGLASAALSGNAAAQTRVYGIELQSTEQVERVLVFADGPVRPKLVEQGPASSLLTLENTQLDPSAPRSLRIPPGGNVIQVTVGVRSPTGPSQVEVTIRHQPRIAGRMVQEGSQIAIEFPRAAPREAPGIVLDGRDQELRELVVRIAKHTGTVLIFDESLQGRISILAPEPFTSAEALALLDTLLLTRGFVALPSPGGARTVVRIEGAPAPFVADLAEASGDQAITTLVRLNSIDVQTVQAALLPMLGTQTLGQSHPPTNALILAGAAAQVTRIANVVRELDAAGTEQIFLLHLRFADVEQTAAQLEAAFDEQDGLMAIWPDARTQTLGMRARLELIPEIRDFVARVDRPAPSRGVLHVIPVQHADPDVLAEIIQSLQQGGETRKTVDEFSEALAQIAGTENLSGREFAVVVDPPTHSLVLQADEETASVIYGLVAELDRPPRQVEVEVSVLEVAIGAGLKLGFDYFLPLTNPSEPDDLIAFLAGVPTGSPSALFAGSPVEGTIDPNPLTTLPAPDTSLLARFTRSPVIIPILGPNGVPIPVAIPRETAALTADKRDIFTRMILRPRLLLVSGEEHEIFVGENVPILTASTNAAAADPLQTSQNIERQDVGVVLRVTPTLGELGSIVLELQVEVSALAPSQAGNIRQVGPTIRERVLTSTVRLESDRVAMIGWQTGPVQELIRTGVPWLRDLPILGFLFQASEERTLDNNLLISVTAWSDDTEVRALREMLRNALGAERGEKVPELGERP